MNIFYVLGSIILILAASLFLFLKFASKTQNDGFEKAEREKDGMLS